MSEHIGIAIGTLALLAAYACQSDTDDEKHVTGAGSHLMHHEPPACQSVH